MDLQLEAQNDLAELRLRQERRLGEMLAEMVHAGNPQLSHGATIGLADVGVTRTQSSRWQRAASLPTDDFEGHITATREAGRELTSAGGVAQRS
jgi:hypothetical protein